MFFIRRRHPLEKVHPKVRDLETAIDRLLQKLDANGNRQQYREISRLLSRGSSLDRLGRAAFRELKAWSCDRETSRWGVSSIEGLFV